MDDADAAVDAGDADGPPDEAIADNVVVVVALDVAAMAAVFFFLTVSHPRK